MTKEWKFREALSTALAQFEELTGEFFPVNPELKVENDEGFWALAEIHGDVFRIRISEGVVTALQGLWTIALQSDYLESCMPHPIKATADELTHISLVWLLLHEMQHYSLGHFAFTGRHYLTETDRAHDFALVSRAPFKPTVFDQIPAKDHDKIEPCLELQADHDAIELVLDAYSPEEWPSLRHRALAISAIMMLIEKADAKRGDKPSSHPKAATRIFQLLGHLIDMPFIRSQIAATNPDLGLDPSLTSDDEIAAFNQEVVLAAFHDAVVLAHIADAPRIVDDLGDVSAFFTDVGNAKLGDTRGIEKFKTVGAKQWHSLFGTNTLIVDYQTDNPENPV